MPHIFARDEICLSALKDSNFVQSMKASRKKVDAFQHGGLTLWVKRPEPTGSRFLHRLLYRMTGARMLIPVERKSASDTQRFEANKLAALRANGIPVPRVIDAEGDVLVLEDTGVSLRQYLFEKRADRAACEAAVSGALAVLASIHRLGSYHAGAQVKNYTLGEHGVSAIDFEESFSAAVPLEHIQFRDVLLFLFSMAGRDSGLLNRELIDQYGHQVGNDSMQRRLHLLGRRLMPLLRAVDLLPSQALLGKHMMNLWAVLSFLTSF